MRGHGDPADADARCADDIKCPTPVHVIDVIIQLGLLTRSRTVEQMARFENLPLDLLPQILVHSLIPDHLASLCLVSRTFYSFSVPKLYRRIAILPWYKSSKSRVCIFSEENKQNSLTGRHAGKKIIRNSRRVSQPRLPCAPIRFASHALQIYPLHEYG